MNALLLAAKGGDWSWLVAIVFIVIYLAVNVLRSFSESAAKQKKQARLPKQPPAREKADPQREFEQFLEDAGLRKPEGAPAKRPPVRIERRVDPNTRRPRRVGVPTPPGPRATPRSDEREEVRSRHLRSGIEDRHANELRSKVERQHIVTRVGHAGLMVEEVVQNPALDEAAPGEQILSGKNALTRAFMMSMIFGPPPGLSR